MYQDKPAWKAKESTLWIGYNVLAILGVFKLRNEDYEVRKSLLFRHFPGKVLYLCLPLTFFCPKEPAEKIASLLCRSERFGGVYSCYPRTEMKARDLSGYIQN